MQRILISLGGNALGTDFDELVASVGIVAKPIVDIIEAGNQVVICHGNGPQVGMIKSSIDRGKADYHHPLMPLSETVAEKLQIVGLLGGRSSAQQDRVDRAGTTGASLIEEQESEFL